jgi:hypothetical protein
MGNSSLNGRNAKQAALVSMLQSSGIRGTASEMHRDEDHCGKEYSSRMKGRHIVHMVSALQLSGDIFRTPHADERR